MSGVDRLPRIKVDHEFGRIARDDIDWLITELERLRGGPVDTPMMEHYRQARKELG